MQVNDKALVTVELHRGMCMLRRGETAHPLSSVGGAAEEAEEEEECAICLESMENGQGVMLRCGHTFHKACSAESERVDMRDGGRWRCPECRALISFLRVRAGKPGQEKTLIDALPGTPQELSFSYLLRRSAGARELVAGLTQVDSIAQMDSNATMRRGGLALPSRASSCPAANPSSPLASSCPLLAGEQGMGPGDLEGQQPQLLVADPMADTKGSVVTVNVALSFLCDDVLPLPRADPGSAL